VAIVSSLEARVREAVTGLGNHPANKQEWQWLAMRRTPPFFAKVPMPAFGQKQTGRL
jgi:hypothetical protein